VAFTGGEFLPADAEMRLAGFTELLATAIANAGAQAEVTASRARIVAAADQARRRIERDLHDGAQQRLVSLALKLRAVQAAVPRELGGQLDEAVAEATGALEELSEIARGIHPAILAKGGLRPALKTLARRSPLPVDLQVRAGKRLPDQVEVSAYHVVAEALTNAAKHSRASAVSVEVEVAGEVLHVAVRDDGAGGADLARGTGLVGLKDRVEALGGQIFLDSRPGAGTSLQAELPLTASRLRCGCPGRGRRTPARSGKSTLTLAGSAGTDRVGRNLLTRMPVQAATAPTATPTTVSARRRMGCCHACWGVTAATTMITAVVIPAVTASPGRPSSMTARALAPTSTASAQAWKGRKAR
jgi:Histidine kinase/Histidine kinase-, DNA gyrase B-, and HSP90-like ATPase